MTNIKSVWNDCPICSSPIARDNSYLYCTDYGKNDKAMLGMKPHYKIEYWFSPDNLNYIVANEIFTFDKYRIYRKTDKIYIYGKNIRGAFYLNCPDLVLKYNFPIEKYLSDDKIDRLMILK